MGMTDSDLIFLVSQPRAGSTRLQRMLGGHSAIHTATEPWLMLQPVSGLDMRNANDDFALGGWSGLARDAFLETITNKSVLEEAIAKQGVHVYSAALEGTGKTMFLDKTPRYYSILPQLGRLFPNARFVVLYRNPLSVFASIIRTWVQDHWERLPSYRFDLLDGPRDLVAGVQHLGSRATVVRYEDLAANADQSLSDLCSFLNIACEPSMADESDGAEFPFGDPGVGSLKSTVDQSTRWVDDIKHPQVWRLLSDYLGTLNVKDLEAMGYDAHVLRRTLCEKKPAYGACAMTHSLESLLASNAIAKGENNS
jgi:hypothetical protein